MTFIEQLQQAEQHNQSALCVGLDPDVNRLPSSYQGNASKIYNFCAAIVDATADIALAFKPQIAYFAAAGAETQLEQLIQHIRTTAPHIPVILDSKRGDIGSTAEQYAIEAFERYGCDAVTLSPYMGQDTIAPYLKRHGKGAFLLCRTSNAGGADLQAQRLCDIPNQPLLYEHIAQLTNTTWNSNGQLGLVVGATYPKELQRVRELAPKLPLLIPGVGAQGGDAQATIQAAWRGSFDEKTGLSSSSFAIVSSSRAILYASAQADFAAAARQAAIATRDTLRQAQQQVVNG